LALDLARVRLHHSLTPLPARRLKVWFFRALIVLAGVIAVLWLGMLNAGQQVDFRFFAREFPGLNLNFLTLLVFIAGMVFSFLVSMLNELQLRRTISRHRRDIGRLERELSALRNLPLDEAHEQPTESAAE